MKKSRTAKNAPVADVVHQILETARGARTDGPASGLYGRDAQLSGALTQAGTVLAKLDRSAPPRRSSLLQNLFGAPVPKAQRPRRSWFFASAPAAAMPDAKRIEQMLRATVKSSRPLVLDRDLSESRSAASDLDCHLPGGAVDPVCTPR